MLPSLRSIAVFCGSQAGTRPAYARAARELGAALASRDLELVYGGASVGLMGIVADAALAGGGRVHGVITGSLVSREIAHPGLTGMEVVGSLSERKAAMAERADAVVALPGGFGTFDELFEVVTWNQLGTHALPCGVLDVDGYFGPLRQQVERAVTDGFIRAAHAHVLVFDRSVPALLDALAAWRPADGS